MESNQNPKKFNRIRLKSSVKYQSILTILFLVVSSYNLIDPFLYRRLIDGGILSHNYHVITTTLLIYVAYKVGYFCVDIGMQYFQMWFSTHTFRLLNDSVFSHFLSVRENEILRMSDSEIQTLINNDTNRVLNIITDFYPTVISNVLLSLISLYILARLSIVACAMTIIATAIVLGLNHIFYRFNQKLSVLIRDAWNDKMGWLIQSYKNISFIKINLLTSFFRKRYDFYVHSANKLNLKSTLFNSIQNDSSHLIFGLLELALLYYLGVHVVQHTLSLGSMIAIVTLTPRFYSPLIKALATYSRIASADSNIKRLTNFLSLPIENHSTGIAISSLSSIEIKDLSFHYEGDNRILFNKLNAQFKENQLYLLTGANGVGKSTIFRILTGCLYNASHSTFVNMSHEINQLELNKLRSFVHYAPQTPYIMKGTVIENIRLANIGDDKLLERIMNIDGVKKQLAMIGGVTRLIDTESQLSGGEKQFISLLQMIYHSRKWVLLDEPFSAMDENLRALSCQMITEFKKQLNATIIIISHVVPDIDIDKEIHIL